VEQQLVHLLDLQSISTFVNSHHSHSYTILKGLKFPRRGKYQVELEQYMRTDTLVGVVSVGASLIPSPN
jgi:hypothetical protein